MREGGAFHVAARPTLQPQPPCLSPFTNALATDGDTVLLPGHGWLCRQAERQHWRPPLPLVSAAPLSPLTPLPLGWLCRQAERRSDIKEVLQHWGYGRTVDMSPFEAEGQYFEGTVRPKKLYC